jgi:protein-S-isoprenylcysteine O-methyltransferase Ste14
MTGFDPAQRPNTLPWPPILFVGALVAANLLTWATPLGMPTISLAGLMGWALLLAAIGLIGWSFLTFRAARTTVLPHRRSDALIDGGPFALSRNPIYLGEAILLGGLGLLNASIWYWLVIPAFMIAVTRMAILREEAHLEARFGDAYRAYKARVRRWV